MAPGPQPYAAAPMRWLPGPPLTPQQAARLAGERVRLGLMQARRVLLPGLCADIALAWLAMRCGVGPWALLFVPVAAAAQLTRLGAMQRLARRAAPIDLQLRLMTLSLLVYPALTVVLTTLVFRHSVGVSHHLYTTVLLGVAAGSVSSAAGHARSYAAGSLLLGGALCLGWLGSDSPQAWLAASLFLLLMGVLVNYVRDQGLVQLDLIRLNEDLERQRERAEQAAEARTRFFAAASHDLRQPLTALSYNVATVEALARLGQDEALARVADGLRRSLAESQGLLDSLLEVSQLDAGAVQPNAETVDLQRLVEALVEAHQAQAGQRGLRLHSELQSGGGPWQVRCDEALLRRVLQNLLGNALKFTQRGEVLLRLRRDGEAIALSVVDSGPGIDEALHERVFEEFFQVGNLARNRSQGLGLGLAIVRRLVALLGLRLSLQSRPGSGSCFTLHLPALDAQREPPLERPAPAPSPTRLPDPGRVLKVLVVDDEPTIREALAALLATLQWETRGAGSLDAALQHLRQGWQPDAAVLDFRLRHGVTGLDALGALRQAGFRGPAWLVTGDSAAPRIQEAQAAGLPVLYKPLDGLALAAQIRRALP